MKPIYPPLFWVSECGTYRVAVARKAYRQMLKLALAQYPSEVGTSLVGSYSASGFRADVLGLAPLTRDSRSAPTWFVRGVSGLKLFYQGLLQRFRGLRHYVGEWHSHPDSSPSQSGTDRHSHLSIARDRAANCPEVVLIILGGQFPSKPQLEVSVYSRQRGEVHLAPA